MAFYEEWHNYQHVVFSSVEGEAAFSHYDIILADELLPKLQLIPMALVMDSDLKKVYLSNSISASIGNLISSFITCVSTEYVLFRRLGQVQG